MTYYRNKEKFDPEHAGNRKEGSPKHINDPFFGTGSAAENTPAEATIKPEKPVPGVHKDYDASKNSGGAQSSTEKPED
jgi:hypothetical protein